MHIAGIDAHATYVVVGVVNKSGDLVQKPLRIRSRDQDRLVALLEQYAPVDVVVEASPAWPWLYDLLDGVVTRFVLAHPKKLRAIAESSYKTDAIDATLLARMQLAKLIPEVHCKSIEQREIVTLVRHRTRLVRLRTQAASRIHGELHAVGFCLARGKLLTRAGRAWVHETAWPRLGPEQRRLIRSHEKLIDGLRRMIRSLDRRIEAVGEEIPAVALLRTVPGIGPFRALLIAAEALPIERFATPSHLVSYAGLAPRSSRSGMKVRYGPIPAGANRWLRNAFVQTALVHRQRAPESWLSNYHDELRKRVDWRVARVATARKIARAVHAMLRTGEAWRDEN
jgi:transposase